MHFAKKPSICNALFMIFYFYSFNPSIAVCWKGCDYGTGRVNSEEGRKEATEMCKRMTAETMYTNRGELGTHLV